MVNKEDAIEIISYAVDNGIDIWLDGGWGVDALLGTQTRVHNDIDLFVEKINSKKFIDIIFHFFIMLHLLFHTILFF